MKCILRWLVLATLVSTCWGNEDGVIANGLPENSDSHPNIFLMSASMEVQQPFVGIGITSSKQLAIDAEYHRVVEKQNLAISVDVINSIPVAYFFDVFHGKFRLGIVGNLMPSNLTDLVSLVNKKLMKRGKLIQLDDVKAVDVQSIFMHGIGVTQYLSHRITAGEELLAELSAGDEREEQQTERINSLFDDLKDELAIDVQMQRESLELNTELQDLVRSREIRRRDTKFDSFRKRTDGRLILRDEQHVRVMAATDSHLKRIEEIKIQGLQTLADVKKEFESTKHELAKERDRIKQEHDLRKMKGEIHGIIAATQFRIEEELRMEKETEETALHVLSAHHKSQTAELEKLIKSISDEISKAFIYATGNTMLLAQGCGTLLAVVIFIVLVIEATTIARSLYTQLWSKRIPMQNQVGRDTWWSKLTNSSDTKNTALGKMSNVILNDDLKQTFIGLSKTICEAAKHQTYLPHIILFGKAGTGKSIVADAIARDSGIAYATINASEVLALGDNSSLFLFDFMDKIKRGRTPTVVILDQVDEIILKRELALQSSAGFTESCFYVLLQVMREACSTLSVILTSKLAICDVDKAILDRIDGCVYLPLPVAAQRLEYSVQRFNILFSPYLDASKVSEIVGCIGKKMDQRDEMEDSSSSPETELPTSAQRDAKYNMLESADLDKILSSISPQSNEFDVFKCINTLTNQSVGWSFRDVDKVLNGVVSSVLSTVDCRLNTRMFITELRNTAKEKSNMTDIQ